jgi:hypothetical protein
MTIYQLPAPDLSTITYGGGVLRLMESYGFSDDERIVAVRATYTDNADTTYGLHYGIWLYDLHTQTYLDNINAQIVTVEYAKEIDVRDIQFTGSSENLFAIALAETKATGDRVLVSMQNGQVVSDNLIHSLVGLPVDINVERFLLSDNGRFLAVQTSSEQLSADQSPDTNDSSDIYLFDLLNNSIERVSFVGGSEVQEPTYLKDIYVSYDEVKIAFITDAAFVSPSRVDINSNTTALELNQSSDAYIWTSSYDQNGLFGAQDFDLLSLTTESKASGYVDKLKDLIITDSGHYFNSSSDLIVDGDSNSSNDAFFSDNSGEITRISESASSDLQSGGVFLSASSDGQYAVYVTESPELTDYSGAQQLVLIDNQRELTTVISENTELANNWVTGGELSASGQYVAFTSAADNLTNDLPVADSGNLFIRMLREPISITSLRSVDVNSDVQAGQVIYRARANSQENISALSSDVSAFGIRGAELAIPLYYQDYFGDMKRQSMDLKFYYNSQQIAFQGAPDHTESEFVTASHSIHADTGNGDANPDTDKYVSISLEASNEFSWANASDKIQLTSLNFLVEDDIAVMSEQSADISFRVDGDETYSALGYASQSVPIIPATWDFDLNNKVDALTDGLMFLRSLFSLTGENILSDAVASDSIISNYAILDQIDKSSLIADIDGNGTVDALTDGLIFLRYLFSIRSEALIESAIAEDATRTTLESITQYIESFMPPVEGFSVFNSNSDEGDNTSEADNPITYSLDAGDTDFVIDSESGEVSIAEGLSMELASQNFTIYAADGLGNVASQEVNLNLSSEAEDAQLAGLAAASDIDSVLLDSSLDDYFVMRSKDISFESNVSQVAYNDQVDVYDGSDATERAVNYPDFIA